MPAESTMPASFIRWNLLITDIGFLSYWAAAAMGVFPSEWLYKDYDNPILVAWNWSFAPVDLAASTLGLYSLALARLGRPAWSAYALISAALTFCAGLMALSFWALRSDFDLAWWLPNLYLVIWPLIAVPQLVRAHATPNPI
jgi:hypothetical protein